MIFNTNMLLIAVSVCSLGGLILLIVALILDEKGKNGSSFFGLAYLTALAFGIFLFSFQLAITEDSLYRVTCSEQEKELRQVTCQRGGIKVFYDNGDIRYEFLFEDKNSTQ